MRREAQQDQSEDGLLHVADVHVVANGKGGERLPRNFHYHNCFEIIVMRRGTARLMANYMTRTLHGGNVVMLRDNLPHELLPQSRDCRVDILHIPHAVLFWGMDRFPELAREAEFVRESRHGYLFRSLGQDRRLLSLVGKIRAQEGFPRVSHLYALLHLLGETPVDERLVESWEADTTLPAAKWDESAVDRAFRYLREHFTETHSLEDIASHANQNKTALCRAFKKATGYTLFQFINRLRVERACELLRNTDESVTNIAYSVGYNTLSHFSVQFRAVMGMSPGEYRRQE